MLPRIGLWFVAAGRCPLPDRAGPGKKNEKTLETEKRAFSGVCVRDFRAYRFVDPVKRGAHPAADRTLPGVVIHVARCCRDIL